VEINTLTSHLPYTAVEIANRNRQNKLIGQRLYAGIRKHQLQGHKLKFITLTSSNESAQSNINDDFQILKKRILRKYFQDENEQWHSDLQYAKIYTSEGNGVIHAVVVMEDYLPHQWLRKQWRDIHKGSWNIHVSDVHDAYDTKQYLLNHYLGSQKCSEVRYSSTINWITPGYSMVYNHLKRRFRRNDVTVTANGYTYHPIDYDSHNHYLCEYITQIALNDPPPSPNDFALFVEQEVNPSYLNEHSTFSIKAYHDGLKPFRCKYANAKNFSNRPAVWWGSERIRKPYKSYFNNDAKPFFKGYDPTAIKNLVAHKNQVTLDRWLQ
jgi:hypothetical protein